MHDSPITVLAGGVGGARFLQGVVEVVPPADVVVVGNVGDDVEPHGLHVSPDLDTVLYTLTGWIDEDKGWGVRGDSDRALERARALGADAWFWLGDLDIGLHLARTERAAAGRAAERGHRPAGAAARSGADGCCRPPTTGCARSSARPTARSTSRPTTCAAGMPTWSPRSASTAPRRRGRRPG